MSPETATVLKYGSMGVFVGVIFTIMVGVNGGFLIPKANSERMAHAAVLANEANICVAQFAKAAHYEEKLKEFKALNFTQRDEFIEKGGWDKMPGEEKTDDEVNRECAEKLAALVDK